MSQIQSIYAPKTEEQLKKVYVELEKHQKKILELSNMSIDFYGGKSASNPNELKTAITTIDQLNAKIKEQDALLKKLQATQNNVNKTEKQIIAQKQKQLALNARNAATNAKLSSSWNQLNQKLKTAELNYKNLAVSLGTSNARTIAAQKETLRLRAQVDKINVSVKRFNGNVGNYKSALGGAIPLLKSFVGAFGLTSGVYLFAGAIKDAFDRIREFDKSMQNIVGIMRTTRADLSDLEDEIIKVAGSSIKTSREVAGLAESLVTLGKTKTEIIDLLKPVNDLAIGLEATSEESAEFLVQTMNAFGAGSDEAAHYADVIAGIRTSTTLDFQKMRDSFQYITPISKILNKDLEETGALLGVLADNGIKAESAGRLLATAQIKLASKGMTLEQALSEINKAYEEGARETELAAKAAEYFDSQSVKIGLTLATQTDKLEAYEAKIRSSGGALEDLTNKQLESLDAKLAILDSTWEKLILSFEKGDGFISKTLKGTIDFVTGAIDNMSNAISVLNGEMSKEVAGAKLVKRFENLIPNVFGLREAMTSAADTTIKLDEVTTEYVKSIEMQNEAYVKAHGSLAPLKEEQLKMNDALEDWLKFVTPNGDDATENLFGTVEYYQKLISANQKLIKEQKTLKDLQDIRKLQAQNDEWQKQIDIILNNSKANKSASREKIKAINAESEGIKSWRSEVEEQIKLLEKTAQLYGKNTEEGKYLSSQIDGLKRMLDPLGEIDFAGALEGLEDWSKKYEEQQKTILAIHKKYADMREEYEKKISDGLIEIGYSVVDSVFERQINKIEDQEEALERTYERQLTFAGESVTAQAEIESQYQEKQEELAKKKEETEKRAFLFQQAFKVGEIAIETIQAVAAIKAQAAILASNPITAALAGVALAQIPLVIGSGAVATAAVLAQTIPAFEHGGWHDGGAMLVNDAKGSNYKEIIETPDGKLSAPQGRNTLMNAPQGTFIHKSYDDFMSSLDMELLNNDIAPIGGKNVINMVNKGLTRGEVMEVMNNHADRLISTIKSQHGVSVNIDENGIHKYLVKKGKRTKQKNAKFTGKGLTV